MAFSIGIDEVCTVFFRVPILQGTPIKFGVVGVIDFVEIPAARCAIVVSKGMGPWTLVGNLEKNVTC